MLNSVKLGEILTKSLVLHHVSDCVRDKHGHLSTKEIYHHLQTSIRALKKPIGPVPRNTKASTPVQVTPGASDQRRVLRIAPSRSARKESTRSACRHLAFEDSRELNMETREVLLTLNNVNNNWVLSPSESSSLSRQSTFEV